MGEHARARRAAGAAQPSGPPRRAGGVEQSDRSRPSLRRERSSPARPTSSKRAARCCFGAAIGDGGNRRAEPRADRKKREQGEPTTPHPGLRTTVEIAQRQRFHLWSAGIAPPVTFWDRSSLHARVIRALAGGFASTASDGILDNVIESSALINPCGQ